MDPDKLPPMMTPLSNIVASQGGYDTKSRTTIFVSNISEYTTDAFIQRLLSYCGAIVNWKRVVGANARLQSFGFCEFIDQESGLRAMRLLNDLKVGDKFLVVKVDSKTRALLDEYEKQHIINMKKNNSSLGYQLPASVMTIYQQETDAKIMSSIQKLLEKHKDMLDGRLDQSFYLEGNSHSQLEEGQIADDDYDFDLVKNSKFSTKTKDDGSHSSKFTEKESKEAHARKERQYKEKLKKFYDFEDYVLKEVHKITEKQKKNLKKLKQNAKEMRQILREYDDDKDDEIFYTGDAWGRKLDEINKEMELDDLDEEEERKEIEEIRRKREKRNEKANKDASKASNTNKQQQNRLDTYNVEVFKVCDMEISSVHQSESDEAMFSDDDDSHTINARLLFKKRDSPSQYEAKFSDFESPTNNNYDSEPEYKVPFDKNASSSNRYDSLSLLKPSNSNSGLSSLVHDKYSTRSGVKYDDQIKKPTVFAEESDDEEERKKKQNKKVVLTKITDEERKAMPVTDLPPGYDPKKLSTTEKKRYIKKIIDSIPHTKKDLYYERVRWDYLNRRLFDIRIGPWIANKIKEYVGEKDETLVNFICDRIRARTDPYEIEESLKMILDEATEEFTIKLWRLLIYETTAIMYGLVDY